MSPWVRGTISREVLSIAAIAGGSYLEQGN
jgi:hypothetical protein